MLHPECKELPEPNLLPGQLSHGAVGVKEGRVQWISMAFESVSLGALYSVLILKTCPHPFLSLSPDQREIPRFWAEVIVSSHQCRAPPHLTAYLHPL